MNRKTNELKAVSQHFKDLEDKFRKRVCKELAWRKATFHKKQKNAASFSQIEVETIKGIGWELADELRRKIAK
ncbi:hypothetical protein ACFOTA_20815 [Chitinophaga sp. GCM10012297]|uniref:Uncharacterized protein n=1 Tax=Chitinophaga chungangae TaxID=2821488 RepID=A0ABS3YJ44_9BACT|nr:hypothetical protein [Chitinophaga chungangae]MBO9154669.1 hypothetical protein [Chitinophaga chungangae]